jgi:hypothetical protein
MADTTVRTPPGDPIATASPVTGRWITWRSVLLGTLAVMLVCGLTPYNDYVVANTYFVGSYLPVVMVLWFFVLIVLINGPLHWAEVRRHNAAGRFGLPAVSRLLPSPLTSGELAVIMVMLLVSCSIPSQGWMRSFIPTLVGPFYYGQIDPRYWDTFLGLQLPDWLFPVESIEEGIRSRIMTDFYGRVQEGAPIPFGAWVLPLGIWGIFIFAMFAMLIGLAVLLRHQWAVNERLPFPIVQLQVALLEAPKPGRMLNDLLGRRSFWMGLAAVVFIQSSVALHQYYPRHIPEIPLQYDLTNIMSEEPWVYFPNAIKSAKIFFTFVGITYFIQARAAFSLFAIYLIMHIFMVQQRMMQNIIPPAAWQDQYLGAAVAFVGGFIWIGRHHWAMVLRHAFVGRREGEDRGAFLSYRTALFLVLGGLLVMVGWLTFLGVQPWVAMCIVGFLLMVHLVVARIVAETGIPFIRAYGTFPQLYTNFSPQLFTGKDIFFSGVFTTNGHFTTRESLLPFSMHALQAVQSTSPPPSHRRGVMVLIAWTLVLGFCVAAASSLYCYYTYATPITDKLQNRLNPHALENLPNNDIVQPLNRFAEGRFPPKAHSPWLHMGIGLGLTSFLQFAVLRWTWWPFMPVGYLMAPTYYGNMAWFSIMLGWLAKVLIVKYGGASLYQKGRPFFVGLIFGEALAAGIWLVITLVLAWMGYEYERLLFLPD